MRSLFLILVFISFSNAQFFRELFKPDEKHIEENCSETILEECETKYEKAFNQCNFLEGTIDKDLEETIEIGIEPIF